jgi:hypothetical protein
MNGLILVINDAFNSSKVEDDNFVILFCDFDGFVKRVLIL